MKQILKSIAFGILLGAAALFVPLTINLIFAAVVTGFIIKVISGDEKRPYFTGIHEEADNHYLPVIPFDDQWYKSLIPGREQEQHLTSTIN